MGERHYSLKKKSLRESHLYNIWGSAIIQQKKKIFDGVSFIKGRITLLVPNVYTGCTLGP